MVDYYFLLTHCLVYVTASRIISHDAALFKIELALYINVQALSFVVVARSLDITVHLPLTFQNEEMQSARKLKVALFGV